MFLIHINLYAANYGEYDLSWLEGKWRGTTDSGMMEGHFSLIAGKKLLGNSASVKNGKIIFYEFLSVDKHENSITLIPFPFGTKGVTFVATIVEEYKLRFENKKNDFPQVIQYELNAAVLTISVEGRKNDVSIRSSFDLEKL